MHAALRVTARVFFRRAREMIAALMTASHRIILASLLFSKVVSAQSPELSMREFASGQIKKGVRSIGFGGDGATWGNYGLVYREHDTAVIDAGVTAYTNGNLFQFTAVGVTTPTLWRGMAIYVLGMAQTATGIRVGLHDPWFGPMTLATHGDGGDELLAVRVSMPLGRGFSIGLQLTYEISHFDAVLDADRRSLRYQTSWLPSGGLGIAWAPGKRWLVGTRVILNHDWEHRIDDGGVSSGLNRNYEFRLGASVSPWAGGLFDLGGTVLDRANAIAGSETVVGGLNVGFEQAFWKRAVVIRGGVDECQIGWGIDCTATAGLSFKGGPIKLDFAYLYDLGRTRIGTLFGEHSHSVLATLTFDFGALYLRHHAPAAPQN
jgi:hypothetical protein